MKNMMGHRLDEIGNVTKAGPLAPDGQPGWNFVADNFNRHTEREWGSEWEILGTASTGATVVVNGVLSHRAGEPFLAVVPVSNQVQAVETNIHAIAVGPSGTQELVAAVSGALYLLQAEETVTYKATGEIEEDSRFTYGWDGYGRLTNVTSTHAATNFMLEFTYYPDGQRATKKVSEWVGSQWSVVRSHSFVYDGWNLISERITESTNAPITKTYWWALDLAGRKTGKLGQEAGGIGGLLAITISQSGTTNTYLPISDHNGNITALLDADSGDTVAQYWYSPFGVLIGKTGDAADKCPFRFQSKYYDSETELYYFGHRYYDAASCKWLSPDPLGEAAGLNTTAFCANNPVSGYDAQGLWGAGGHYYTVMIVAYAAGYSAKEAQELAFHAQMSDQIQEYDAILGAGLSWQVTHYRSTVALRRTQEYGHSLLGIPARPVRNVFADVIASEKMSLPEKGVWVHAFGDLYAHSYEKEGVDILYPPVWGHSVLALPDMHAPDYIGHHHKQYAKYVRQLFDSLKQNKRGGPVNEEIISRLLDKTGTLADLCRTPNGFGYDMDKEAQEMRAFARSVGVFSGLVPHYAPERLPDDLKSVPYAQFAQAIQEPLGTPDPIGIQNFREVMRSMERQVRWALKWDDSEFEDWDE